MLSKDFGISAAPKPLHLLPMHCLLSELGLATLLDCSAQLQACTKALQAQGST